MNNIQFHLSEIIDGEIKVLPSGEKAFVGIAKTGMDFRLCYYEGDIKVIYEHTDITRSYVPGRFTNFIGFFSMGKSYTVVLES